MEGKDISLPDLDHPDSLSLRGLVSDFEITNTTLQCYPRLDLRRIWYSNVSLLNIFFSRPFFVRMGVPKHHGPPPPQRFHAVGIYKYRLLKESRFSGLRIDKYHRPAAPSNYFSPSPTSRGHPTRSSTIQTARRDKTPNARTTAKHHLTPKAHSPSCYHDHKSSNPCHSPAIHIL